ncbi:hypothetical protein DPMN_077318 [Dreissena polymorpha]|uniref:Uncharacterized protein n=1 Tax=Dreissena polymorpha TaxID=45954 RepID=A0A9D3YP10_DREPO|nr:hypothetical protein DPMN_077318 [Dreissena polymorpha]
MESWIGYVSEKVPYLFQGCAHVQITETYSVAKIGYCQNQCGHAKTFGIKAKNGEDILNPAVSVYLHLTYWAGTKI